MLKRQKVIVIIWTLLLLIGIDACTVQKHVVDHSFTFLDTWGLVTGYEVQYTIASKAPLDNVQKEKLFFEASNIASAYGREIKIADFVFKRDSIEKQFINDVIDQMEKNHIEIKEVKIINLIVPKQIAEAIISRATILKEAPPTRIKSYDR